MVGSGDAARSSTGEMDRVGLDGSAGGGLEFLGATDSRRERVVGTVVTGCAGACSGTGIAMMGEDLLGSAGDG